MASRAALITDAAVTVVAREGLRGLTHRAVDSEAGLPDGSTSNLFRSRRALIEAIVGHLEELDRSALTTGDAPPSTPAELARYLATNIQLMTSRRHVRATRARFALLLDDTAQPALEAGHQRFLDLLIGVLTASGHPAPGPTARAVSDLAEGALVHAVSVRSRAVDVDELATALVRLLR